MSAMIESASIVVGVPNPRTRIVVVEAHAILREALRALIETEPDLEIAGDFGGIEDALAGIYRLQPDLVLTHLALPGSSAFELLFEIKHVAPHARTLVMTANDGEAHIRAALNAGADGCVLKDANRAQLMQAIRTVSGGQRFLCGSVNGKISSETHSGAEPPRNRAGTRSMTGRERQVLALIALGESNKAIARALALSVKTIEKHRSNMMRKLDLHNAAAVTLFAVRNGLTGDSRSAAPFDAGLPQSAPVG
jgi:DNA-binding NarL/FixJ family response regulator